MGRWLAGLILPAVAALPALAQAGPAHEQPENTFMRWVWIVGVFVLIWVFLYKMIYPFLLPYYRPATSKGFFWTLFWLYSVTWLQIILYTFFDYGFHSMWIGASASFLGVLFLIAFLVVLLRNPS